MSKKPTNTFIIAAVGITLVVAAGVIIPWYFGVYKQDPYPTWDLELFGDTVDQSKNVTYQDIREEIPATNYSFNYTKWWSPDGYSSEIRNYTGIPLWDLIQYSGVDYGRANAIRFIAYDAYDPFGIGDLGGSPSLSLDVIQNNKTLALICFKEENEFLTGPEEDGNGYLMSAVDYSVDESIKSSHYNFKNLIGIEFVIDWNLTLYGDLVDEEMSISYEEILTSTNLTRFENTLFNYTQLWDNDTVRSTEFLNVSGVTLWSIIEYTDVNYTTANHVNFTSFDGWESYSTSLNVVENDASEVLIVYAINGELLDPDEDGYLMSLVDYTVAEGSSSSKYKANFLNGIEFTLEF